jgi:Rrf2 family iron-sulfur cluster assembly transcriptional regulator
MFSKACEYGIRAVIFIVSNSKEGKRVGIRDICEAIEAPQPFTAKILQDLSRKGVIASAKGPNGGFYMDEDAPELRLIDVVSAIDGDQVFIGCGLGLSVCSEEKPCPIHYEFAEIRNKLKQMLESTTVNKLTSDLDKGLTFLSKR